MGAHRAARGRALLLADRRRAPARERRRTRAGSGRPPQRTGARARGRAAARLAPSASVRVLPPSERPIPQFAAEPPQEPLPYGRWGDALGEHFARACAEIESDEDVGDLGPIAWFPDRSYGDRTYIPASSITANGFELFGYVSFTRDHPGAEATGFEARADYTDDTAEANPDWKLDLRDEEIGAWRGPQGRVGQITLVWGDALVPNGALAIAELGPTTTDQCPLSDDRFTLISLDNYTGDLLTVRLWGRGGREIASESLYDDE